MIGIISILALTLILNTEAYAMSKIYDYSVFTPKGEEVKLSTFAGKVLVIVNTATGCGFTPQYEQLEEMYRKYHDKGLEIIDIPCNQFGNQAPGSDEEIHAFCTLHFNTTYDQFKKADVNGPNELPLYTYLKSQKGFEGFGEHKLTAVLNEMLAKADPDFAKKPDIKWNFTKFVVDRSGNVVARFEPTADMADVEKCAASLL
ncbi:MAG: glutathione peroxidase [Synergistaceae bacterium]|nr:glutathione peroxidase [Synergistaceae bacterium]